MISTSELTPLSSSIESVHKALEDELKPEKLVVRPVSEEERFGLRSVT